MLSKIELFLRINACRLEIVWCLDAPLATNTRFHILSIYVHMRLIAISLDSGQSLRVCVLLEVGHEREVVTCPLFCYCRVFMIRVSSI